MKPTTTHLKTEGYSFECVERGNGPPLLFVHGSMGYHRTWRGQLEKFAGSYRAIAYSRRYHWPNEPITEDADYAMDRQVQDLASVIETLAIAPARIVGHSYGGFLALLLAIQRPDLVRCLVLAEPPVIPLFISNVPTPGEILRLLVTRPRTAAAVIGFGARGLAPATKAVRAGKPEEALELFGRAVLGKDAFERLSPERLVQVRDNFIAAEFLGTGFCPLSGKQVSTVKAPTLLLNGALSPGIFHRLGERLEELLPDVRRVAIPGASHIIHEDNPSAFDREVVAFLEEVDADRERVVGQSAIR